MWGLIHVKCFCSCNLELFYFIILMSYCWCINLYGFGIWELFWLRSSITNATLFDIATHCLIFSYAFWWQEMLLHLSVRRLFLCGTEYCLIQVLPSSVTFSSPQKVQLRLTSCLVSPLPVHIVFYRLQEVLQCSELCLILWAFLFL